MNTKHEQHTKVVTVAENPGSIHSGEKWPIPDWIERAAWTPRMLATLQRDESNIWYSLFDKLGSNRNLQAAWKYVRSGKDSPGVDRKSLRGFEEQLETNLTDVREELVRGSYKPAPMLRKHIPKMGSKQLRPIGISTVRDRVVHTAIKQMIEPIFERVFVDCSFGFRPGRGPKLALRAVQSLLDQGYRWVVDADIESFFDSLDHDILGNILRTHMVDGNVLALIDAMAKQPVMQGTIKSTPTKGTPQGAILSPVLANIYLHPMDQALTQAGLRVVRYADDLVILCKSESEAQAALEKLKSECEKLKLTVHPTKTHVVNEDEGGFDFLGFTFRKGKRFPRLKSQQKWRDAIVLRTPRSAGTSMAVIIAKVNQVIRGIVEYFKHGSYPSQFQRLDAFVRRRLRAILLRRAHKTYTFGQGRAHNKWPNVWFAKQGLISACEARATQRAALNLVRQPR